MAHNRAPKQEREIAAKLGGAVTKASGAAWDKGDVRVKGFVRVEAKCTTKKSFSITKDMLDKIEEAGLGSTEWPLISVEFLDDKGRVLRSVAVIPQYALDMLIANATAS